MDTDAKVQENIINKIEKHLHFLFANGARVIYKDFSVQGFTNWLIVLEIKTFRVRIYSDRGEVFLSIGPIWAHSGWQGGPWFDIEVVIAHITHDKVFIGKYHGELRDADKQIARLSDALQKYYSHVVPLFTNEEFSKRQQGLELTYNRVVEKYLHNTGDRGG